MREISIRLPFLLPTRNVQDRMHFHQKRALKDDIIREFLAAGVLPSAARAPMAFAEVTVWRHSTREPDIDGLYGSLKQILDVIQPVGDLRKVGGKLRHANLGGLGIIANDSPSHLVVRPLWVKARQSEQHTMIRIREQEPAEVEEQETLLDIYRRAIGM